MTTMADRSPDHRLRSPAADEVFSARFREAFRTLWLVAVAIVGDASEAEDVVQEAALIGLTKLDAFDPDGGPGGFTAWMAQIVRFVALNARRKDRRHNTPSLPPEQVDARPGPDGGAAGGEARLGGRGELPADQAWFDDRVVRALGLLQETARACLLLRTLSGLDYAEISRIMGVPEGTAMSHVHRSRIFLRQTLAHGGPPPQGDARQ
jgi:RNA polymerase sigma-70 factor (ECF subfamily)